jgi:hypothetical protein
MWPLCTLRVAPQSDRPPLQRPTACSGLPSKPETERIRRVNAGERLLYGLRSGACSTPPMPQPVAALVP